MTANPSRARLAREGVRVRLPDGRRAIVTTRYDPGRGRIVIVKPIKGSHHGARV